LPVGVAGSTPARGMNICVVCCTVKAKEQAGTVKRKKEVRKKYKERKREELQEKIPPETWISVSCRCCVLPDRVLCDGPIFLPEKSNRLWCVTVCGIETEEN
jgi:hypothetical protein